MPKDWIRITHYKKNHIFLYDMLDRLHCQTLLPPVTYIQFKEENFIFSSSIKCSVEPVII